MITDGRRNVAQRVRFDQRAVDTSEQVIEFAGLLEATVLLGEFLAMRCEFRLARDPF